MSESSHKEILIPQNVQNTLTVSLLSARQFAEYCRLIAQITFLSLLHTFKSALSSLVVPKLSVLSITFEFSKYPQLTPII